MFAEAPHENGSCILLEREDLTKPNRHIVLATETNNYQKQSHT